ncbi:MAG: hypothetical protein K6A44_01620 [bacterium]|nr:hypothetical protein [bacterium]
MKISEIKRTQPFNARLCGDLNTIIRYSKEGGMPEQSIPSLLKEIHEILPNKKDRVFFIFRKPFYDDYWHDFKIRSQIEVLKDGDEFNSLGLRANVYPFKGEQKDLLGNFVQTLKKLVKREIKGEELRTFFPERKHPWIEKLKTDWNAKTGWVDFDEGLEKTAQNKI